MQDVVNKMLLPTKMSLVSAYSIQPEEMACNATLSRSTQSAILFLSNTSV